MKTKVTQTPRYRERGRWAKISNIQEMQVIKTTGAVSYPFTGQIRDNDVNFRYMNDTVTRPFAKAQGEGQVVFSAMDSYDLTISGSSDSGAAVMDIAPPANAGNLHITSGNWLSYLIRTGPLRKRIDKDGNVLPVLTGISSSDEVRVLAEASTRACSLPSDAQLLVSMAEFMQVVRLLPSIIQSFTSMLAKINNRYARAARRNSWGSDGRTIVANLANEVDFLSNLWLATRFGIRPTVSDAVGMYKALQRLRTGELVRITSRGAAQLNVGGQSNGDLSYGILRHPASESTSDSFSVRAMTLFAARLGVLDDLGINLANVPLAVVDLTRFSFVLNWMVNVNEFASAMGTAVQPGWDSLGGCVVRRRETSTLYQITGSSYILPAYTSTYAITKSMSGSLSTVERVVRRVPGAPIPSLTVRADPFRWTRDARLIDAVTLFRQQVRGRGVNRMLALAG